MHAFRTKDGDILNLPQRKSQRLRNYDYSQNGAYFITICTHNKEHLFGTIGNGISILNEFGHIVEKHIEKMSTLYEYITIDKYVVMPNHAHIIIMICRERIACVPQNEYDPTKLIIPKIVQGFKSAITKECREITEKGTHTMRSLQKIWQKSYYDHIIRNEAEYKKIWEYIDTNPLKWELDEYYT